MRGRCSRTRGTRRWSPRPRRRSGAAIAALVNALDPDAVVIGGGLGLVRGVPRGCGLRCAPVDLGRGRARHRDRPCRARRRRSDPGRGARRSRGQGLAAGADGATVAMPRIHGYPGRRDADVAQLVEHITRNDGVRGSSPRVGLGLGGECVERNGAPRRPAKRHARPSFDLSATEAPSGGALPLVLYSRPNTVPQGGRARR